MYSGNSSPAPIEKIISVLSYCTMGIAGLIWIILAYVLKKRLKYFLMYNIAQSMIISIVLAIFGLCVQIILSILSKIPFLDFIAAIFNTLLTMKVLIISPLGMQFSIFELFVFVLLLYIVIGVLTGRIFYVPVLTNLMKKVMQNYN